LDALARHRLNLLGLDPDAVEALPLPERVRVVHRAFVERLPIETLTRVARRRERPAEPETWLRTTDRCLREAAREGTGGTSFAVSYALADCLRGVGANAHTTLAHHLEHEEPHAATLVYLEDGPLLLDLALFALGGVPVRPGGVFEDALCGHALEARRGPMLTLFRMERDGKARALYSWIPMPAPPDAFRRAWLSVALDHREPTIEISRRVGDEVLRYDERKGTLEVECRDGCRSEPLDADLAECLHAKFGVSEPLLRAHFAVDAAQR
jgi:hypothetical protein